MSNTIDFARARQGFRLHNQTANRSPRTTDWYDKNLVKFEAYVTGERGRARLQDITAEDVREFVAWLQARRDAYGRPGKGLSPYTVQAYVRTLSSFFRWAVREELIGRNPMDKVSKPKVPRSIKPKFEKEHIQSLLAACDVSYAELAVRNKALILFLLDTGVRAGELCGLTLDRLDPQLRRAHVTGKGMKDRYVPVGARTREWLWKYINVSRPASSRCNHVFLTQKGFPFNVNELDRLLAALGKRAGVTGVHAHRFRHTFARTFIANGGDQFSLRQIMGHERLETTSIYVQLEQLDMDRRHELASPVDRWGL